MALGDPYLELDRFKEYLNIKPEKQEKNDLIMEAIKSASSEIEKHCNRQFQRSESATTRVYEPGTDGRIVVDDFWSTTGLVVEVDGNDDGSFSTTVPASDYELYPLNGVVDGQVGWPYYEILMTDRFAIPRFSRRRNTVRVTAKWGWQNVPEAVRQACVIVAHETFQLKDAPFGTAGMDQFGNIYHVRDNRIAAGKLARYCRNRIPVG